MGLAGYRFGRSARAVGCRMLELPPGGSASLALAPLLEELPQGWLVSPEDPELASLQAGLERLGRRVVTPPVGEGRWAAFQDACAGASAGLLSARVGVVPTGAVGWSDREGAARLVSGLPPVLIVILREEDLVDRTGAALDRLQQGIPPPRWSTLLAGPSRTADIGMEQILGAHGPVQVHILLKQAG